MQKYAERSRNVSKKRYNRGMTTQTAGDKAFRVTQNGFIKVYCNGVTWTLFNTNKAFNGLITDGFIQTH